MIRIFQKGAKIEYTQGDTFCIRVSPRTGETFLDGSTLEFIIANETSKEPVIQNTYNLEDGVFNISFTAQETKIPYGEYAYKMILRTAGGIIATQKSGEFTVKWGE